MSDLYKILINSGVHYINNLQKISTFLQIYIVYNAHNLVFHYQV